MSGKHFLSMKPENWKGKFLNNNDMFNVSGGYKKTGAI